MIMEYDKTKYVNPFNSVTKLKSYRDLKNVVDTAIEEAKLEEKKEIATKMKNSGFDIETIKGFTGLSKEEIENL